MDINSEIEVHMSKRKNYLDIFLYKGRNMSKTIISETPREEIKSAIREAAKAVTGVVTKEKSSQQPKQQLNQHLKQQPEQVAAKGHRKIKIS